MQRSVLQQVKEAYFQTAYIQQTLEVLDRNGSSSIKSRKSRNARYRVGQGKQQDVLKAQLEKTKLLRELAHHHEIMGTQQALLMKLLNRPAGSPEITTEPLVETPFRYTSDELLEKVRAQNPEVATQQEMVKKQSLQVEMARKGSLPGFQRAIHVAAHRSEHFPTYYMLTFSARLPIYRRRKLIRK